MHVSQEPCLTLVRLSSSATKADPTNPPVESHLKLRQRQPNEWNYFSEQGFKIDIACAQRAMLRMFKFKVLFHGSIIT